MNRKHVLSLISRILISFLHYLNSEYGIISFSSQPYLFKQSKTDLLVSINFDINRRSLFVIRQAFLVSYVQLAAIVERDKNEINR